MELTVEQALQQGVAAHKGGRLQEAEHLYRAILQAQPTHPDANHNLGLIENSVNKAESALLLFKTALEANPKKEQFWLSYIDVLVRDNQVALAKEILEQGKKAGLAGEKVDALETWLQQIASSKPPAKKNSLTLKSKRKKVSEGKQKKKTERSKNTKSVNPPQSQLNHLIEQYQTGKYDEAERLAVLITQQFPGHQVGWKVLGAVYGQTGRQSEAINVNQRVVQLTPQDAEAHYNLGLTLQELSRSQEAEASYRHAIALKPDYVEAHSNLGNALNQLGRLKEAEASCRQAISLKPDFALAHNNLGNALQELGRLEDAEASYRCAIALQSDSAEIHSNLGITLKKRGRLDEAVSTYRQAIALNPDYAEAYSNLGLTLDELGRLEEALANYERTMALNPNVEYVLGATLYLRMSLCIWDELPQNLHELMRRINNGDRASSPFHLHSLLDDPGIHRKAAEIYSNHKFPGSGLSPDSFRFYDHEKIRVGYFSPDFKNHPVSSLTAELYEIHDRNKFEIHAFSFSRNTNDQLNIRIRNGVDHFHCVHSMSDQDVVALSRSLKLDIAVDLAGFTRGCRPGIFALAAAPIQLGYIGFLGTMGASYYDYLISDKTIIPEQNQQYYSESIVYLPSYQVNDSRNHSLGMLLERQDLGIPEGRFVYCCFNNTFKITPDIFDSWARILEQVEHSVLMLYAKNRTTESNLKKEISLRGVDPRRLVFGGYLARPEYLARYQLVDLFLDTTPYNGGATASDALRMGLPVLTLAGKSFAGRLGASLLSVLNLPELIGTSQENYEAIAVELATDPEKINILKQRLISNLSTTRLYNTPLYTKGLEAAYQIMSERHRDQKTPSDIYIND